MPYSAHYIIYTALSTLYLRALHPDCMFATKLLYNNNHLNNKDVDVPFGFGLFLSKICLIQQRTVTYETGKTMM